MPVDSSDQRDNTVQKWPATINAQVICTQKGSINKEFVTLLDFVQTSGQ